MNWRWKYFLIAVPVILVALLVLFRFIAGGKDFADIAIFVPGFFLGWLTAVIAHFVYPRE